MLAMKDEYANPAAYWETRLTARFDLTGAGCGMLGPRYNAYLYQARLRALERALNKIGCSFQGQRILEVGCGTGFYTAYCAQQEVVDYVGIDITSISVHRLAQQYPQLPFSKLMWRKRGLISKDNLILFWLQMSFSTL